MSFDVPDFRLHYGVSLDSSQYPSGINPASDGYDDSSRENHLLMASFRQGQNIPIRYTCYSVYMLQWLLSVYECFGCILFFEQIISDGYGYIVFYPLSV